VSGLKRTKIIRPPAFSFSSIARGLRDLAAYTDLLITLSMHRVRVRYKQSALGLAWAVLQPLALMFIYTIIFSVFTRVPTKGTPYPVFVFCALLPWTFFATSLSNTATSLVGHTQLITKVYFPREILPITYVVAAIFDFLVATAILAALMAYYAVPFTLTALYAIPAMLVAIALAMALGLLLAAIQVRFRDIGLAMPLLLQIWMFASPVVYPLSSVPARFRAWYDLNPMVGVVDSFRRSLLENAAPDPGLLGQSAAITAVLLPLSYMFFKHREATMADLI